MTAPTTSPAAGPATAPDRGAAVSREWKPGDVAAFDWKNMPIETGVRVSANLCRDHDAVTVDHWHLSGGGFTQYDDYVRPLAVINPEDREQVERLATDFANGCGWSFILDHHRQRVAALAAALRNFITPPKPERPLGLGAVVEDDGDEYVHFGNGCWIKTVPNAQMYQRGWSDMTAAVKVLSEGVVTP